MSKAAERLRNMVAPPSDDAGFYFARVSQSEVDLLHAAADVMTELAHWRDLPDPLVAEFMKAEQIAEQSDE